jgi:hypothetical protein
VPSELGRGWPLAERWVTTNPRPDIEPAAWAGIAASEGTVVWAVEGTRKYGLGRSRFLATSHNPWSRSTVGARSGSAGRRV